ncbi:MAG: sodium:alanine symporter family protein, partial [Acidobacteria bacterium]|nr:sodium:alanine symporter family protein [Acidobacteriota bacterium]
MELFLNNLASWLDKTASNIWTIMVPILFGVGLILSIRLGFIQFRKLGTAFKVMFSRRSRKGGGEGDVSPFAAVSTALAATVGNGN